ncbi:uncharacterized protein TRAVEDRAFT_81080, partial [Trametes versicolor FP-101664 SS1]|uniref:uncharacterized protein n=1 Tax=Trametes versicolor (strain FP-101664) TaxID=717944 RepID=UPI00046247A7
SSTSPSSHACLMLTPGRITPAALFSWEAGCRQYFCHCPVEEANRVGFASGGFQDARVMDWWITNSATLEVLSFEAFMAVFRKQWLPANWANEIVTAMFQSKQNEDNSFDVWVTSLEKQNAYLRDTTHRLSNTALRGLITATACEEMRFLMLRSKYFSLDEYSTWKAALIVFDNERLTNRKCRFCEYEQFARSKSVPTLGSSKSRSGSSVSSTGNSGSGKARTTGSGGSGNSVNTASLSKPKVPRLTEDERRILMENNGCFKCRRIGAGHQSKECPNGFPDLAAYNANSLAEQLRLKSTKIDTPKVAAITISKDDNDEDYVMAVAAVTSSPIAVSSAVLSDGDSSDDDVHDPSFSVPHVTWHVHVKSPCDNPEAITLIDTGSPLALIRDDAVERLQLRRRKLHTPVPLGNTFDGGETSAKEWCKLTVSTPDGSWTSVSVWALIVSLLCSPIILGTPFLSRNRILVDYQYLQACFSLRQHRDVIRELKSQFGKEDALPAPVAPVDSTSMPPWDRVATVRERVEELAFLETLKREDVAMKTQFTDCFPDDIPHLDSLPKDEYHHIRLKDANMTIVRRQYDCPKKYREAWK